MANQNYQYDLEYFENPLHVAPDINGNDAPVAYRRKPFSSMLGDHVDVYEPIETGSVSNDKPIYVSIKGTDSLYNLYTDISIITDFSILQGWGATNLGTFNTEVNTIYNTLRTYLNDSPRPIVLIGHSLGGYYGIHLLKHLVQNHPAIVTKGITAHFFNALTLVDDAFIYFRDLPASTYDTKANINFHCINGDFATGLLLHKGVGTVWRYTNESSVVPVVDDTTFTYTGWLQYVIPAVVLEYHSITAFGGSSSGLGHRQLLSGIPNDPISFTNSIRTVKTKNIGPFLENHVDVSMAPLDVIDIAGNQSNHLWLDYPKHDTTIDKYNFSFTKSTNSGISSWYIISSVSNTDAQGNTYITKYINFPYQSTSANNTGVIYHAFYVRKGNNKYMITTDGTSYFRLPSNVDTSDLPLQAITATEAAFDALVSEGVKDNFRFNFIPHISLSDTHLSNRRFYDTAQVPLTGLRALFQSQYNGAYGYFNIKLIDTAYEQAGNTAPLYCYMEDGNAKTVYARPGNPVNTSQGNFGIDHNDNSTNPDEHVWKVTWIAGQDFTIENTVLDGTTKKYFGSYGAISGVISTSNNRAQHDPVRIECLPFSEPNLNDEYYLNVLGQSQNYNAYHYVVSTLYHYVDFYTLNSENYNSTKLKFKFEPI